MLPCNLQRVLAVLVVPALRAISSLCPASAADDVGASNNFAGISVSKEALEGCGSSQLSSATAAASSSEDAVLQAKLRVDFADLTFNEMIGKGSFKTVYRGRWNNTAVAIVCMRKGGMVTEARVLQRLSNHPNLVQFYR